MFDILCLSHLAWERTLFQRPQHLMLRLAQRGHSVVYAGCVGVKASLRRESPSPAGFNVPPSLVCRNLPCAPTARSAVGLRTWYAARRLRRVMQLPGHATPVLWIYHPALLPLGRLLLPDAPVVYDVMDRFTAFASSHDATDAQELQTLRSASAVFTGGRSLDRSIGEILAGMESPPPVQCLPSGVDLDHFARALDPASPVPLDIAGLPRPVFGYYGAVDERIDFDLLTRLALAWPGGSVVLIGPVLGAPPPGLPENLRLLGPRRYDDLPCYVRGFDVCLLPFRDTPLVAHVSPTKTPEYLAGGRPVVSTPIPDVVADYGDAIRIGPTAEEFVKACGDSLNAPPPPAALAAAARLRAMTWDQIAERMERAVAEVL